MAALGKHVFLELYGCSGDLLDNAELATELFNVAVEAAKMHVEKFSIVKFNPIGLTAYAVLSTSHMSIHTYPELGYCAADVFTCGQEGDPVKAAEVLINWLHPARYDLDLKDRGTDIRDSDIDQKYMNILNKSEGNHEAISRT